MISTHFEEQGGIFEIPILPRPQLHVKTMFEKFDIFRGSWEVFRTDSRERVVAITLKEPRNHQIVNLFRVLYFCSHALTPASFHKTLSVLPIIDKAWSLDLRSSPESPRYRNLFKKCFVSVTPVHDKRKMSKYIASLYNKNNIYIASLNNTNNIFTEKCLF